MKNFILIIGILSLFGCSSETTTAEKVVEQQVTETSIEFNATQIKNAGIELESPKELNIGAMIRVTGTVEVPPQNKTAISFPYGGFVKTAPVLDGMFVRKGQVLVTLEDPTIVQMQQDYLEAKSQLEFLQQDYERQKSLGDQQVNSGKTVQQAKSSYMGTLARCKGMKIKLEMAGVNISQVEKGNLQRSVAMTAPFSGIVTKMNAAVGHYVTPQEVLLEIIDLKHCHIELSVFEKDVAALKIGQKVHIQLANSTESKRGTIYLIGKEIGMNRMVKVHCHLDEEDPSIIPGSYVQAEIDLTDVKRETVPTDAIANLNGKSVVFWEVKSNKGGSTYEAKKVEILGEEEGRTAFRYLEPQTDVRQVVVVKGTYAILSSILMKMQPE